MNFFLKQQQSFVKKYCVFKNSQRDMAHKLQYYSHNNLLCSPWLFIHLFKIECAKLQMKIIISRLKQFFFPAG